MAFGESQMESNSFEQVSIAMADGNLSDVAIANDSELGVFTSAVEGARKQCSGSLLSETSSRRGSHPPSSVSSDEVENSGAIVPFEVVFPSKPLAKDALFLEEFPICVARAAARGVCGRPEATKKGKRLTPQQRLARIAASTPWIAAEILRQVESISVDFFSENIPLQGSWGLSLLVCPELKEVLDDIAQKTAGNVTPDAAEEVSGHWKDTNVVCVLAFISYRAKTAVSIMEISKVGVRHEVRKRGYGKRLVLSVVNKARQTDGVKYTSLSSLADTVGFYRRIGFVDQGVMPQMADNHSDRYEEGQVHMEIEFRKKNPRNNNNTTTKRK